jgi:DNA-binding transcriptional MocR family regulator
VLEIAFHPDRTGEVALVHQLTQHLAGLIETGRLVAGCKLPATREAAAALGIGRNTVSAARDGAGQVVYAGTFSKVLFPSLRLGYVAAARPLLARLATMRLTSDFGSGVVEQAALATLLATRGFDRHVRRMRRLYAARLAALLAALQRDMPPGTRWTEPRSGHVVWITLPPGIDPDRLEQAARDRGVGYTRGETFHVDGRGRDSLALSCAPLDPRAIAEGVARLGAAVRAQIAIPRAPGHVRPAAVRSGRGRRPAGTRVHGSR